MEKFAINNSANCEGGTASVNEQVIVVPFALVDFYSRLIR